MDVEISVTIRARILGLNTLILLMPMQHKFIY